MLLGVRHEASNANGHATSRPARNGEVVFRPDLRWNGIKIFSATMFEERNRLGETITAWIAAHPDIVVSDITVTQSSDAEFHCVAITVAYWQPLAIRRA